MSDLKESKISPTFNNPLPEDVETIKFIKESFSSEILHDSDTYFLLFDLVYRLVLKGYLITLGHINYGELIQKNFGEIVKNRLFHFSYGKLVYKIGEHYDYNQMKIELNEQTGS